MLTRVPHSVSLFVSHVRLVGLVLALFGSVLESDAAELRLRGQSITDTIFVGSTFFAQTDSLILDGQLLRREIDYYSSPSTGRFVLSPLETSHRDSLTIKYTPIPSWLKRSFGRDLPGTIGRGQRIITTGSTPAESAVERSSAVSISGAKSFRFSARTEGDADFGQSLDLKISGELSPGLQIEGNLSDRGTDPAHGPLNSQLNELDRLNLRVRSQSFSAQLGDLSLEQISGLPRRKQLTGLAFNINQERWHLGGILSRPKGSFQSIRISGSDGLQGPYRLDQGTGGSAVVPGSETVWLNGDQLQRGTDKDYQIDYATGWITFNVSHPIDARSRIEVDYEPRTSEYKKELISTSGGVSLDDSTFFFTAIASREGDDSDQPLIGEFTAGEKENLSISGDNEIWISGVRVDSLGRYQLVADSLPDSVFVWVEEGSGGYSITYTYVGQGIGSYVLIGSGQYLFVGPNQGDYLPIKRLIAPRRTDYYQALAGFRNNILGEVVADFRQTSYDQNLISDFDDADNNGHFYELKGTKSWGSNSDQITLSLRRRLRQEKYQPRQRTNDPDFERRFLLPIDFSRKSTELLHEAGLEFSPITALRLNLEAARLDFSDHFSADQALVGANIQLHKNASLGLDWNRLESKLIATGIDGDANAQIWKARTKLTPWTDWNVSAAAEFDSRENSYQSERHGTRYARTDLAINNLSERVQWEYYTEDSLVVSWSEQLNRHRLTFGSTRRAGNLNYNVVLTRQWLDYENSNEATFLGRLSFRLDDQKQRLNIGASYMVSDEVKNSRGISYLEVNPGEGDFIFDSETPGEGGEYVPDPDGNYIRIEEILSGQAHVRKGERSFLISKRYSFWQFRFDSRHVEELLDSGERRWYWILPFVADETQPYLFFNGRHSADLRLYPIAQFHFLNLTAVRRSEIRQVAGTDRHSLSLVLEMTFREKSGDTYFEQSIESFRHDRDTYYSGVGEVKGFETGVGVTQKIALGEASAEMAYRRAKSTDSRLDTYSGKVSTRLKLFEQGQLRVECEGYRHRGVDSYVSLNYQVTDNRPGRQGLIWSSSFKYGIGQGVRAEFTLSGRHAEYRTARVIIRGEVIATF